ncbi:MAG: alpha-2-macroglobulin family protein [Bacteroidales bacterium]
MLSAGPSPRKGDNDKKFARKWQQVDSLLKAGLPQSALSIADEIYREALKKEAHDQTVKALIYRLRLRSEYQEQFLETTIREIESLIPQTSPPFSSVLHSVAGELYWRYFTANRSLFYDRTHVTEPTNDNPETWDLERILSTTASHYRQSLEPKETLIKTDKLDYSSIILDGTLPDKYTPSLYDFLAYRALQFFKADEASVNRPVSDFSPDNPEWFAMPEEFASVEIPEDQPLSFDWQALRIYRDLVRLHQKKSDEPARLYATLERLDWLYRKAGSDQRDTLYMKALNETAGLAGKSDLHAEVYLRMAQLLDQAGRQYAQNHNPDLRFKRTEAARLCRKTIEEYPGSRAALLCRQLLNDIEEVWFDISFEEVWIPNQPAQVHINYKNCDTLWYRIAKVSFDDYRKNIYDPRDRKEVIRQLLKKPLWTSGSFSLPDFGDYQQHSAQTALDGLPPGLFIFLASDSPGMNPESSRVFYSSFWSSDIAYVAQRSDDNGHRFFLHDRTDGHPISGAEATVYYRKYNYRDRKYQIDQGATFISDENGFFAIPSPTEGRPANSFFLKFNWNGQQLATISSFSEARSYKAPAKKQKTWFFTDRSIYRPGQTVWFKGIVLEQSDDEYSPKSGVTTTVTFYDANYQKISEQQFTTNEFGTFNGSFRAPAEGLNGVMQIRNETGSTTFRVESYKRPRFRVTMLPLEGSYKLNDTIAASGIAESFAGFPVTGANVEYRVTREVTYPWYFDYSGYYRPWYPEITEIAHGTLKTGPDGKFIVEFPALPDLSVDKKYRPWFRFRISVSVTDINGETQQGESFVQVGYEAFSLRALIPEMQELDRFTSLEWHSENLNGRPVSSEATVSLSLLKSPGKPFRPSMFEKPDTLLRDAEQLSKLFPYDLFDNRDSFDSWEVEEVIFKRSYFYPDDSIVEFYAGDHLKPGVYRIAITATGKDNDTAELVKHVVVFDPASDALPYPAADWFTVLNDHAEPGGEISFLTGTGFENVLLRYQTVRDGEILKEEAVRLSNGQKKISIPVTEELRGGFDVNLYFVNNNRVYEHSFHATVPYTNKELDISFETFRDRLEPGQREEWRLVIHDYKGAPVLAEMAASLYDASLDQFTPHHWAFQLYRQIYGNLWFNKGMNFSLTNGNFYSPAGPVPPSLPPATNDKLNWFGFDMYAPGGYAYDVYSRIRPSRGMTQTIMKEGEVELVADEETQESQDDKGTKELQEEPQKAKRVEAGIRRDLRETAFFYPALKTDDSGRIVISFTMPEALTTWKLLGLTHTTDMKIGYFEKEIVTNKPLMVVPNLPRFLREGDTLWLPAKVVNRSDEAATGEVSLELTDPATGEELQQFYSGLPAVYSFNLQPKESKVFKWKVSIPRHKGLVECRITARSGNHSDGELIPLPVLGNKKLVTETLPFMVEGGQTKSFRFETLQNIGQPDKGEPFRLTLEAVANPVWYVVQALPYISESGYEPADATFRRFYSNKIGSYITQKFPLIQSTFDAWQQEGDQSFYSKLETNQKLKEVLLRQTPWVLEARNEKEQKQRILNFFDRNRMEYDAAQALRKLKTTQNPTGGWSWYEGMPDNRFMTLEILTGFGKLKELGIYNIVEDGENFAMFLRAIRAADQFVTEDYNKMKKRYDNAELNKDHLTPQMIQYLYMRTIFLDDATVSPSSSEAFDWIRDQAATCWSGRNNYQKTMIALALDNLGVKSLPTRIMQSVREYALYDKELGMWFRDDTPKYNWYGDALAAQALYITAFDRILGDKKATLHLRQWLLNNKRTNSWPTSRSSAEAVYALLSTGEEWLVPEKPLQIIIGSDTLQWNGEAGTGLYTRIWEASQISGSMADIKVYNPNPGPAWGGLFYQYFDQLDKIEAASTPLSVEKDIYIEQTTDRGPVLSAAGEKVVINPGDKLVVRLTISTDRDMEFVHLQDLRPAGTEPLAFLSGSAFTNGLSYYRTLTDEAAHFFFDFIPRGTYVLEYRLVAGQEGSFASAPATLQSWYAPEFSSHSEGSRIKIE